MLDWILKKLLGTAMVEKFVGTKLAVAVAALLTILINHGMIRPADQVSAEKLLADLAAAVVAVVFMIARAWTDTTAIKKSK